MRLTYIFISIVLLGVGCGVPSPTYQKTYALTNNQWAQSQALDFPFEINDTQAVYQLFFLIRHTTVYPFSNIWLNVAIKRPLDSAFTKSRCELNLTDATGKWLGAGMGEIWEQRMPFIINKSLFNRKGKYVIRLTQIMRRDPLPEILQVGLRLENYGSR